MLDHDQCQDSIDRAMESGNYGWAEYLEARCRRRHLPETVAEQEPA